MVIQRTAPPTPLQSTTPIRQLSKPFPPAPVSNSLDLQQGQNQEQSPNQIQNQGHNQNLAQNQNQNESQKQNPQFMALLDSLEARVDLMAQMQRTREVIQKRGTPQSGLGNGGVESNEVTVVNEPDPQVLDEMVTDGTQSLIRENTELLARFRSQHDFIARLNSEIESIQKQLDIVPQEHNVAAESDLRAKLKETDDARDACNREVQRLQQQLAEDTKQQEIFTQQWLEERTQLHEEIQQAKAAVRQSGTSTVPQGNNIMENTTLVQLLGVRDTPGWSDVTPPFSQTTCGANLILSDDCYTASRTRGCRQSVAVGSAPLIRQTWGWFFEVVIEETVSGWVGGLGIGVTRTAPGQLHRVPDKAWRMPGTFIVGYWGCVFLEGKERRVQWRSDTLRIGSRVGVLVTCDGSWDLIVFVNDQPVVRVEGALSPPNGKHFSNDSHEALYPVVDVFAATKSITLSKSASAPTPPWEVDTMMMPGSPVSRARSMSTMSVASVGSVTPPCKGRLSTRTLEKTLE